VTQPFPHYTQADWFASAREIISRWLPGAQIDWLAYTHNAVFAVEHEGKQYVLRLKPAASPEEIDLQRSEEDLLQRLYHGLGVPVPVRANYRYIDDKASPSYGTVLYEHLEGDERTPATLTIEDMRRIGAFLARLHDANRQFDPSGYFRFARPRLDYAGLYGDKGTYALTSEAAALFNAKERATMEQVQAKVKAAMDSLGTDVAHFGLIHGDLLLKNILFQGDEVRALDFEYCGFGYFLYDLAPLLWQLKPEANYAAWEDALWEGYTVLRRLPPRDLLEIFIAGRQVASLRWVANNQHNPAYQGKVPAIIQQRISELEGFLATGVLRRG
jgi:Ser/Thr protein kinase RdoA (MazF antagonist)